METKILCKKNLKITKWYLSNKSHSKYAANVNLYIYHIGNSQSNVKA